MKNELRNQQLRRQVETMIQNGGCTKRFICDHAGVGHYQNFHYFTVGKMNYGDKNLKKLESFIKSWYETQLSDMQIIFLND